MFNNFWDWSFWLVVVFLLAFLFYQGKLKERPTEPATAAVEEKAEDGEPQLPDCFVSPAEERQARVC